MSAFLVVILLGLPALAADGKEDLIEAARKGDLKTVEALLAKGVDVNAKNAYGVTALYYAASKGHLDVVKLLIKHKADVNAKDSFYQVSILDWTTSQGHAEVVRLLLEAGATGADNALLAAVQRGKTDLVRAILDKGKVKPESLNTALQTTRKEHAEIAALLQKAGAKLPPPTPAVSVDPEILKTYAGVYEGPAGTELTLALKEGKLVAQLGAQVLFDLIPVDKTTFKVSGRPASITFKQEGPKVTGFTMKAGAAEVAYKRGEPGKTSVAEAKPPRVDEGPVVIATPKNWPSFRGPNASGIADGQMPPAVWDAEKGLNIRWKTPIPGLGHSCPIVWGDRLFLTTAISGDPKSLFRPGLYGDVDSVNDTTTHIWRVYCLDKHSGKILWEQTAHQGVPKIKRHMKGSHANCTPATDGKHVIVCLGSEGLYCYDFDGKLVWKRDLGVLDSGFFFDADYQWGFGSSPILYRDLVILQCDVGKNSFIAAYQVADGKPVWQTPREEIPSWGTPTIYEGPTRVELLTNATKYARGYDPLTGKELWRLARHAEITVPAPVAGAGLIFITSGYRPIQPIYAIRPGATGDISLQEGKDSNEQVAWSKKRGGPYMTTPIVYGDYLYTCANNGLVTCHEAETGKQVYEKRLGGTGGYTASPVAADGKLYFTGEEGGVRVVKAGPAFELLSVNRMGDVCMATPAISDGMIFVRTQHHLFGIARAETAKTNSTR
jgi:outer membrane protein assembly factor BamB